MKSTIDVTYFRKRCAELQEEIDATLARDGDALRHARESDILRAVRRALNDAREMGRRP